MVKPSRDRFERGTRVKVKGMRGEFRFQYWNTDGSATLYGGPRDYAAFRVATLGQLVKRRRQT